MSALERTYWSGRIDAVSGFEYTDNPFTHLVGLREAWAAGHYDETFELEAPSGDKLQRLRGHPCLEPSVSEAA